MSKKNRRASRINGAARPTLSQRVARNAAAYRLGSDMLYQRTASQAPFASLPSRPRRVVRLRLPITPSKPRNRPVQPFSSWFATPTPPQPVRRSKGAVSVCASRSTRRQVLFATRSTGAGAHARKRYYSNRSCK